jgi:cytoskeletal protein RodZ
VKVPLKSRHQFPLSGAVKGAIFEVMPTVGQQLRAAREAQKLTIYEVAEMTQIRSDHIRAIDQGNYDVFSAPVYIRGFVRTYATALKLNPRPILDLLNQELAASGLAEPDFSPPAPDRADSIMFQLSRISWRTVLSVLAAIAVVSAGCWGYLIWHRIQTRDPLEGLSAGLHEAPPSWQDTLPLPIRR